MIYWSGEVNWIMRAVPIGRRLNKDYRDSRRYGKVFSAVLHVEVPMLAIGSTLPLLSTRSLNRPHEKFRALLPCQNSNEHKPYLRIGTN